ncbi:tetratricopeptide repeat protein [Pontibacterium sp.]|uniref:tetratricopeptide repeat protein n=1 Tax=Pontibacterium sp. TaxID=2036026 RepID=UPI003513ADE6
MRHFLIAVLMLLPLTAQAEAQLSQRDYQLLTQAFKLIEAEQYAEAHKYLMEAKSQVGNDYARALISHNLGQVELQRERYGKALGHLRDSYELNALPKEQQINLIRTLAQLNCIEENWSTCASLLEQWMHQAPGKVKGDDHLLLAQAYSRLKKWSKVVKQVSAAINSRDVAPENWYQLKVVAHIRLRQWRAAIREQKRLISHYADKPLHWRRLVSLQLEVKDQQAALATQRMGFERNLLRKDSDYRLLAEMMLQAQVPYFAGLVIQEGVENGVLNPDKKTLKLLSRSWIQAHESEKAVDVLVQLNQLAPSRQSLTRLAHMQIELRDWQGAQATLLKALKHSQGKQARLQLLLGITRIKLKSYEQARHALSAAAADKQLKATADGWVRYLDQISLDSPQAKAS